MSQSQSPAYTAMAATAVAVGGGSFAVMLQLSDYIGSNFGLSQWGCATC